MANTIQLKLLDNKRVETYVNGYPNAYEGGYRIIAGEQNATAFEITSVPEQYANATYSVALTNSAGENVTPPSISNKKFTLPVGMAVAGYGTMVISCVQGSETVVWSPIKIKVWNTNPDWKSGIVYSSPPIKIGKVTTLPPDEEATVTNSGTPQFPVLDFGIPQGESSVMHALLWGNKSYDGSSTQTITAADLGLADVYKPQGSVTFANLPATPNESNYGYVWNISDDFTTDSRFLEGAGKACQAGTNVGVIEQDGVYYYDILGAFMDLSNYAEIDGAYPTLGAGYLARNIICSNSTGTNGYFKICTFTSPKASQSNSFIFLINGIYGDEPTSYAAESGIIEFDIRSNTSGVVVSSSGLSILSGNLNASDFFIVPSADLNTIDFYIYLQQQYGIAQIIELAASNLTQDVVFDGTRYTTAPSGAVYAVNRNVAAKVENALTIIKDGVSTVYDGSEVKTVEITEGGSGITIVTIPQDGVSTNPVMSGTIELASPENTVIKIYNGEDNDGARYTYSILTSFDENASGDVPEYVYSGEDYIVTCTKSNGNTYNYTLTETPTPSVDITYATDSDIEALFSRR